VCRIARGRGARRWFALGKAELAVTYGCTVWFDGSCQARGQFVLARRRARWVVVA
jgi:hypothetical protein